MALITVAQNVRQYKTYRVNLPDGWVDEDGEIIEDKYEEIVRELESEASVFTLTWEETGDTCDEPEYNIWIEEGA